MVKSKALPRRPLPLPPGERPDRACAIALKGKRPIRGRLTRNVRARLAYCDPSPTGSGEAAPAQRYRKMV